MNFEHFYDSKCAFNSIDDIKNKHITIMGLGLNGGGIASALFFARYNAFVTITDMKSETELAPSIETIKYSGVNMKNIRFVLGRHDIEDFKSADCVIKNPGVKFENNPYLAVAKHIETDLSIFLRFSPAPIIAITGSKGKSSTASAIHFGLCNAGFNSFLGGNITVSPLSFFEKTTSNTPVVLELSSWQLSDLRGRNVLKPKIAVLTTIVPDHQNWYGAMEPYVADKKLIYKNQTSSDATLCKANDKWGEIFATETKGSVVFYDTNVIQTEFFPKQNKKGAWLEKDGSGFFFEPNLKVPLFECTRKIKPFQNINWKENQVLGAKLKVPGIHMKENMLIAAAVLSIMGVSSYETANILSEYNGIEHRLECFFEYKTSQEKSFRFYNDSAATVPEATAAALSSFEEPVVLILGGTDKQCSFEPLVKAINENLKSKKLKTLYLLEGTATQKFIELLKNTNATKNSVVSKAIKTKPFDNLESLLKTLKTELDKIDTKTTNKDAIPVIVFSPGATSFGMFKNEFDRGNTFKKLVKQIFDNL
ncbi:MAG: UDP-N-acetylmuramoyl-L-alanine--D-glutamate ligase [Treponema sp.]|nr:UDP-N-acetylmuramoyl-L-alanine--D-glutamate ligase [Treponema sp.]